MMSGTVQVANVSLTLSTMKIRALVARPFSRNCLQSTMPLTPPHIIIVVQLNGFISSSLIQKCPLCKPPTFHLESIAEICGFEVYAFKTTQSGRFSQTRSHDAFMRHWSVKG